MAPPRPRDAALLAALLRRLGPADAASLTNFAWLAARRGEPQLAQEAVRRAMTLPGAPPATSHALERLAAGHLDGLLLTEPAPRAEGPISPETPVAVRALAAAVAAHRHADLAMAETCYRAALGEAGLTGAANNGLAVLHFQRHEFAAADTAWQHAMASGSPQAIHNRALAWLRNGELGRARAVLEPWLAGDRADATLWFLGGYLALAEQEPERALSRLERSLDLDPELARAHFTLGLAHERLGHHVAALQATRKALLLAPWYVPHVWQLGGVEGVPLVEVAIEGWAPGSPAGETVLLSLGRSLLETGHLGEALAVFDQVLIQHAQQPTALFHRGVVLAKLRRYGEALEDWEAVERADPSGPLGAVSARHARSARQLAALFAEAR